MATEIPEALSAGIRGLIDNRGADGSFGFAYPERCPDGCGTIGTNKAALVEALGAHRIYNQFVSWAPPSTMEILELIEFAHDKIAEPHQGSYHQFFDHHHLEFDQAAGQARFREEINLMFERNGIAFELRHTGRVEKIAPAVLREDLSRAMFNTGDNSLDQLLEKARTRFLNHDPTVRRESLETLWDAW